MLPRRASKSSIAQLSRPWEAAEGVVRADKLAGGWRQATHGAGRAVLVMLMLLCSSSTVWL